MKATQKLHDAGQSLWLDNITRDLLTSGTLKRYIDTLSVTGLTSNPTIFDEAVSKSAAYDEDIRTLTKSGLEREDLFFELAIADLQHAADLFKPIHDRTAGVDGWVSLEVSPLLAYDAARTVTAAKALHDAAARPNLFIKIPGTKEGLSAIEEATFSGVAVNVTLHLLARALPGCGRRLYARTRAPDRGGPEPGRAIGRVAVRQPLGQGDDGDAARRVARSARDRGGAIDLCRLSRPPRFRSVAASRKLRRAAATAPVRQHRNEGSRRAGYALHRRAGGAQHRQHHARRRRCSISPITGSSAARCRATEAMPAGRSRPSSRRASIPRSWRDACSRREQNRSTIRGAISSRRSGRNRMRWVDQTGEMI